MRLLDERIAQANSLLVSYAVPHGGGLGRVYTEAGDDTRFPFQRDRDRIIHTQAFRRLKRKTQVFASGHGDHYRTRITHTLEVAQISRDVARTLGLNEDLAEAIALAHDLGHTPFGHAGEEAMRACMASYGKTFEHNQQSLRIVTLLEERSTKYPGLNLSWEILEGLMKHRTPHDRGEVDTPRSPSLEAQIVNLADEIAYTAHDTDDALRANALTLIDVQRTVLGKRAVARARQAGTEVRGALVHLLVSDLYETVPQNLRRVHVSSLADVYAATHPLITFSEKTQHAVSQLRALLWQKFYGHPDVRAQALHGAEVIRALFEAYVRTPPTKVIALQRKKQGTLEEAVKDYIAGMTDSFAEEQWLALHQRPTKRIQKPKNQKSMTA